MSKKTIILTGANGWLGKGIFSALLGVDKNDAVNVSDHINYPIRVVIGPSDTDDFFKTISSDLVKVYKADIREIEQLRSVFEGAHEGLLLHTAGVIHPKRTQDFYDVNEFGTKNLLDLATMFKLSKAVILSSNSPIGCNPFPDHVFDEESPYNPYMNYGNSKKKMELLVNKYYSEGKINTVIIRAPWFYGPFQPERQTLFFEMIRDGKGPIVGSGRNMRSMAYIDNLVQGVLLAALSDVANGQTYWIADERPYSMNEIIDTVESVMRDDFGIVCKGGRLRLPGLVSDVALIADKMIQGVGLYHQKIHVLSEMNKSIACSVEKAKRELGYTPHVDLRDGMRRSISWMFQQNIKL